MFVCKHKVAGHVNNTGSYNYDPIYRVQSATRTLSPKEPIFSPTDPSCFYLLITPTVSCSVQLEKRALLSRNGEHFRCQMTTLCTKTRARGFASHSCRCCTAGRSSSHICRCELLDTYSALCLYAISTVCGTVFETIIYAFYG